MESVAAPENDVKAIKEALLTSFFDCSPQRLEAIDLDTNDMNETRWYHRWRELRDRRLWPRLIRDIYDTTGILSRIALHPEAERLTANHRRISSYFLEYLLSERSSLHDAVRHLRSLYDQRIEPNDEAGRFEKETEEPRVRIMTIHASKGLGFPIVFLAGGAGKELTQHDYLELRNRNGGTDYWIDTSPQTLRKHSFARIDDENRRLYYVALTRAACAMYLPIWHPDTETHDILRKYHHASPSETFLSACFMQAVDKETRGIFHIDESSVSKIAPAYGDGPATARILSPDETESFLGAPATTEPASALARRLRALSLESRYRCQTSYTALAHARSYVYTLEGRRNRSEEPGRENEIDIPDTEQPAQEDLLPRGGHIGNMLHEIMERVSFEVVGNAGSIQGLLANQPLLDLVTTALHRASITETNHVERIISIVWHCLRARIPDPAEPGSSLRLCDLPDKEKVCEMEFHFAFDKRGRFGAGGDAGHILGYVDLLFRYRDRYYILDWKSNHLPSYSPASLKQSMKEKGYTIQKMLYTLATDHWLRSRLPAYDFNHHFGGVIYCFMRGARENGDTGFIVSRPPSKKALLENYGQAIRAHMLDNTKLRALLTSGSYR
ncbi:MAG: hypothetical protein GF344_04305 [Chitinivibrionales bacterium]|nr:hypothetical protein [Chitinivibrionales bacterium]MBD3356265.1 hypothetical protein [Chitinivibrionales bacterium]